MRFLMILVVLAGLGVLVAAYSSWEDRRTATAACGADLAVRYMDPARVPNRSGYLCVPRTAADQRWAPGGVAR